MLSVSDCNADLTISGKPKIQNSDILKVPFKYSQFVFQLILFLLQKGIENYWYILLMFYIENVVL